MTRARTPGSLSTRTAMVCRSTGGVIGRCPGGATASHQHHAVLGDRLFPPLLGAEQHLVDEVVALGGLRRPQPPPAEPLGELYEIRQRRRVALRVTAAVQQLLPLPHHPHVLVVE